MLVVFDVDGTLTRTGEVEARVYAQAFAAVYGTPLPTTDWAQYASPTDRGVAEEVVLRLGLDPRRIPELRARFVADLGHALERETPRPVPGAERVLEGLERSGHSSALATGAWEGSARLKLAAAGIEVGHRVLVGSDFHARREEIVREAVRRCAHGGRVVYVGDGLWDLRAARILRIPFIGVDSEGTGALRRAGVEQVIGSYLELGPFLAALRDANVS